MKLSIRLTFFFIFLGSFAQSERPAQGFDKTTFYSILKEGRLPDINEELNILNIVFIKEKDAYEGTLLMRKAGIINIPGEKLKLFKDGRIKLENSILKDNLNPEYRFLRLTIEEHAPKILDYGEDLDKDKQYITLFFKNLSPAVKQAIVDYAKTSKILNPADFNN